MPAGQHDAAMVDLYCARRFLGKAFAFSQSASAGRAPIRSSGLGQNRITLAANSFHTTSLTHEGILVPSIPWSLVPCISYTGDMPPLVRPVRLIAIDMDGTLLPAHAQSMSQRTVRSLVAAQSAGIIVAIATGRRLAYTLPLLEGLGLRADTPLITSNGAVTSTLCGETIDRAHMNARVARGVCGLLRPFGAVVFTFDRPGRGELVLEDLSHAHGRIALWVEANRNSIEVVKPLELALVDGEDPIQGMAAGSIERMRAAEKALKASEWSADCGSTRTEYPSRDLSILDLLPPGVSKGWALERLAARLGVDRQDTMAIGDNWNDEEMLEWAEQGIVMANAAPELRALAKTRGWKQTHSSEDDGVAVVLEAVVAKMAAARV